MRANGQLDSGYGWARAGNFEWAIETLRELDAKRPNDPRSQADLAEARSHVTRTRGQAIATLETVARLHELPALDAAYRAAQRRKNNTGGRIYPRPLYFW